jgi:hypothetical protein
LSPLFFEAAPQNGAVRDFFEVMIFSGGPWAMI